MIQISSEFFPTMYLSKFSLLRRHPTTAWISLGGNSFPRNCFRTREFSELFSETLDAIFISHYKVFSRKNNLFRRYSQEKLMKELWELRLYIVELFAFYALIEKYVISFKSRNCEKIISHIYEI